MRIFAYILVIVVLVLNLVPCADTHDINNENVSSYCAEQQSSHKRTSADACTPFCHCSCCAASTTLKMGATLKAPFHSFKTAGLYYMEDSYSTISHIIWQPPKLV
ncbi:DUF6660 family protein [Pedobacter psychroterrae]|uniref:Uncharacterized protein n=1 Tax=Pedobacter psychroterrae TaxID=2530453 RepID=A0A4R0NJF6_9SPHI|nr:DUF6660 family protein [Pedobacter psychroterrae]TCD00840.1 hypothetical protein EZ437_08670 [Pedobacter psychroterrae]